MQPRHAAASDIGRTRDHNEDSYLVDAELRLYIVADGMGGHAAGEVASGLAVKEVRAVLEQNRDVIERFESGDSSVQPLDVLSLLEHAVQQASGAIYKRAQAERDKRGMGTTCSLLLLAGQPGRGRGFIAHVGDSRVYLVRQGQPHQLTEDHTLTNDLIRRGKLKPEQIDQPPFKKYKNAVTRAVGLYESVGVETFDLDVLAGDAFLLCSDGLSNCLSPSAEEVAELFKTTDLVDLPGVLIERANQAGGHDNITAICVYIAPAPEVADVRAEEVALKLEVLKGMQLFRYLTYPELVRVMNSAEVKWYEAGATVIREGERGEEMFVILAGRVRLCKDGADIASLAKGAHFGEIALVDHGPRSASAVADLPSRLLIVRRRDFYEIVRQEPALSVKLLWSFVQALAERLRKTTADLSGARRAEAAVDLSDSIDDLVDD